MARNVRIDDHADWSGGINLRADGFSLAPNESPDMLNVDVDGRGGFRLRNGVAPLNTTALGSAPNGLWVYEGNPGSGIAHIMTAYGTKLAYSTGGAAFTDVAAITQTTGLKTVAAVAQGKCYIQNGTDVPKRWDGTTGTALGVTFNDNLTAPNGGDMPIAKCIAYHLGHMWVANTTESATAYPSRVRFSHPTNVANTMGPEDWRTDDYFDLDIGTDGDEIVALVPFQERLFVFKRKSIYMVVGVDESDFQVVTVSRSAGAIGQQAVVATEQGIFFFDWPTGVHVLRGNAPEYVFSNLRPAIDEGSIPDTYSSGICLGYSARRVYVSVPWGSSTKNARTFVYDTTIGKSGSWMVYDLPLGVMAEYKPKDTGSQLFAIDASTAASRGLRVLKLNQISQPHDNFGLGTTVAISSYLVTPWYEQGSPAVKKKYRRPIIVASDQAEGVIVVDVFKDFDGFTRTSTFNLDTDAVGAVLVWDTGQWDVDSWGASTVDRDTAMVGQPLGLGRAVQLKFTGPTAKVPWAIRSLSLIFIPRRVR